VRVGPPRSAQSRLSVSCRVLVGCLCAASLLIAGCSRPAASPDLVTVEHEISPAPARVGITTFTFKFADSVGPSLTGARIRADFGIAPNTPVLGGVMRCSFGKRPELWTEVAIRLAGQLDPFHAILVGDGPMLPQLRERVRDAGYRDRIHFVGQRTPVEPWMRAMDVLFLSSLTEGMPNVLVEAQSLGVPVATMAIGKAGAANAGLLAIAILALSREDLAEQLVKWRAARAGSAPAEAALNHGAPLRGVPMRGLPAKFQDRMRHDRLRSVESAVVVDALFFAALIAALTIYDMVKAADHTITIEQAYVARKTGGKSGVVEFDPGQRQGR